MFPKQFPPLVSRSSDPVGMVSTHWSESGHRLSERELRFLDLLARQAADFIEQRTAESRLRLAEEALRESEQMLTDESRTMTRMHDLADRLLVASDLSTGLNEVLRTAVEVFRGGRGASQIPDPKSDALSYAASLGFDTTALAAVPPIDRDSRSTCAACIRAGGRT